jgi:hypothetical protein
MLNRAFCEAYGGFEMGEIIKKLESVLYFLDARVRDVTDDDRDNYVQAIHDIEWVLRVLNKLTEI